MECEVSIIFFKTQNLPRKNCQKGLGKIWLTSGARLGSGSGSRIKITIRVSIRIIQPSID